IHFSARPALPQTLSEQAGGRGDQIADELFNGWIGGLGLLLAGGTKRRAQQDGWYLWVCGNHSRWPPRSPGRGAVHSRAFWQLDCRKNENQGVEDRRTASGRRLGQAR